jgi:RNA polymerase sigma-70 factor (ECF subfamily)
VEIEEHLFRRESGRMIAVLTRVFGVHNLALAEDVVQDAFCRALEVWKFRGLPENPAAWLMAAAKNRALDMLRRQRTARTYEPELSRLLGSEWTLTPVFEELFSAHAIKDDELRMMFSCCHPRLAEEAQVALILHILCGFSVGEIAGAFVSSEAAIEKRITRAKKVLAGSKRLFEITNASDFSSRLPAVHRAFYLLFNEGYHGASAESAVRAELCQEAISPDQAASRAPACCDSRDAGTGSPDVPSRSALARPGRRGWQLEHPHRTGSIEVGCETGGRGTEAAGPVGDRPRTERISRRSWNRGDPRDRADD